MISYCSQEHMAMDRERSDDNVGHGEICNAIKKLTREGCMRKFSGEKPGEWYIYHKKYVKIVKHELSRDLRPHEERILMCSRSCLVCHKETELRPCPQCLCVDYCEKHLDRQDEHKCKDQNKWLYTEMRIVKINPAPYGPIFHDFPDRGNVADMESFYETYMLPARGADWTVRDIVHSDYVSRPLTVYYGIQDAKLLEILKTGSTFVIHIVEASNADKVNLPFWEIFLHVFDKPTKLIVITIGSELGPELENKSGTRTICWKKCMRLGHKFHFEYHRMLYHNYVKSKLYTKPDVFVGFHVQLSGGETWRHFLTSLQTPMCPLILTARSVANAKRLVARIQATLGSHAKPVICRINRFKSYRLHKDYANGRTFYRNQQIVVYKNLCHIIS